jgi:GT2 family glycosyltransferase
MSNFFSASIVIYHTKNSQLDRILRSLTADDLLNRIYIIDNGEVPSDYSFLQYSNVEYIRSPSNLGYGRGHNLALVKAIRKSSHHIIVNPDIYFEPGTLKKIFERVIFDPMIGSLMPRVLYPDGSLQYLCKFIPTPLDLLFRILPLGSFNKFIQAHNNFFEMRFTGYDREMNVPYLSGCFMVLSMAAIRDVGFFDDRYFMYPEDIDLTRRLHSRYKTIYYPMTTVFHEHAKESYKNYKMLFHHIINIVKYFNKWGWVIDKQRSALNGAVISDFKKNGILS